MLHPYTAAIIVAGGSGTRVGGDIPKQLRLISGTPVLFYTLFAFDRSPSIDEIILVVRPCDRDTIKAQLEKVSIKKPLHFCNGGKERQASVFAGIDAVSPQTEFVAIHDVVRCLITTSDIERVLSTAYETKAASATARITDTVKQTDRNGLILQTIDRDTLAAAQTPQVFSLPLYQAARKNAEQNQKLYTDDNALFEAAGIPVTCVFLKKENPKITVESDFLYATFLLEKRKNERRERTQMRIGHGYDVHRLKENRPLVLGGVHIPYEKGLEGHSDADVLIHAVMDALLGAAGLSDIGIFFPDTDDRYLGADSLVLLRIVKEKITEAGYAVCNIDATVIAQAPKLASFLPEMKKKIAAILDCGEGAVNVKATTEEHLGFTGNGQGIAAHAVCLLSDIGYSAK